MAKNVRVLVVAGGGSGSDGGGGAGGMQDIASQAIESQNYTITVGTGGVSSNGVNSSFGSLITSIGGGRGYPKDGTNGENGNSGGSGGGGNGCGNGWTRGFGGAGTVGQGYAGGEGDEDSGTSSGGGGGGGGGAGGVGQNAPAEEDGDGGNGLASNITGASVTYAAGGGANDQPDGPGSRGAGGGDQPNTGNGGNGSNGGSGIVVVRYLTSQFGECTGGTITTSGTDTIHTFTSSGTFSVSDTVTSAVTDIDFATATGNGEIIAAIGVTVLERGFVWSTSTNPTIALATKVILAGTTGTYSGSITGLNSNTLYYVRAYFTDTDGLTTYGANVTFTTLSVEPDSVYYDMNGVEGETYAVQMYIGGTTGTVTVSLGSTGYSEVFAAGAGTVTFEGAYGGLNGMIFEASATFDGWVDNVFHVLVLGTAVIDWNLDTLTNVFPINSSVLFRRLEDEDFNRFRIYRYLDIQFKDLDAYVTVLLKKEANEGLTTSSKEFLVNNESASTLPFINKRISMLAKNQAILIGLSNNRLSESFTVCQLIVKGIEPPEKMFDASKIISVV
jgi:hypothetical protein